MKKSFFKGFVSGVAVCIVLATTVSLAQNIFESIEVVRGKMNLVIGEQRVDIDNFLYNDTTYVPLRKFSEALDMVVKYDSETSTASVMDKSTYQMMSREIAFLVNGQPVRTNYFTEIVNYYKLNMGMESVSGEEANEFKEYVRGEVTTMMIIKQIAEDLSISLSQTERRLMEEKIALYENNMGGHDAFIEFLNKYSVSYETYYSIQENFAIRSKVLDVITDEITDEELLKYYEENKKNYLSEKVSAKHILIKTVDDAGYPYADSVKLQKKVLADEILGKIKSGEYSFNDMMYEYSQDPALLAYSGVYTFGRGEMLQAFETAAFSMEKGQMSEVIESEIGYHIIYLVDKYRLYESFDDVKQDIYNTLRNERYYIEIEPKIKRADIIYNREVWDNLKI